MSLYNELKNERINAMKNNDNVKRHALESVLSELDTLRGRNIEITETTVIQAIKKEIKVYTEMNRTNEVTILYTYLPKQLTLNELTKVYLETPSEYLVSNPGNFIKYLDTELNLNGLYDKALAVKLFNDNK